MTDDTDQSEKSETSGQSSADTAGVEAAGFESQNNPRDETQAIMEAESPDDVDKDLLEQIEEERKERLDPDNRPDGVEVDNTQRTFVPEEARFEDSDLSEEQAEDGIGQKEPDPETQATPSGSDDGSDDEADRGDDADEAAEQADESDASTGPEPTDGDDGDEPRSEPGRHKA